MKKKIIVAFMAAVLCMSMITGCSSKEGTSKTYRVGVCQLVQHVALDAATKGFEDALKEKLGDAVTFDLQNAQGDSATCSTIVNQFVSSNVDLILANATAPLQAAAAGTTTIPVLGTSITDYASALDIEGWTGVTGRNISGTSDLAPLSEQANMLVELFPQAQKVGIIYCSAETNSQYQAEVIRRELEAKGLTVEYFTFVDTNDVAAVARNAADSVEVIYVPTDNTVASNTEIIDSICRPAGVPIIAGEEGICANCGVATLSISYYDIGYTTGEMAYEILVNGKDISKMEVRYAPHVTKKYNAKICAEFGITLPEGYTAIE